jgi:uncharacterized protein (TIRG00374 family)
MVRRIVALVLAAVGLYFVWPALVSTFGSFDELSKIRPVWFVVMVVLELASFACVWLLIGVSTSSSDWMLIATSQLASNAVSSIVPGGAAIGAPLQIRYMVQGGIEVDDVASGLTAASLLTTTTLFGLAALCVPVTFRLGNVDPRLQRAGWLGLGAFVVLLAIGAIALSLDAPLRVVGRAGQWVADHVPRRRRRASAADADKGAKDRDIAARLLAQRDRVRHALGTHWFVALVAVVSKWAFDYLALVAAVAATGARVQTVPVLLAYVAASVLGMIPITPGGLGFVEAGLAATLLWAGLPGADATLATLAYRLVSYWLPLVLGLVAGVVLRARQHSSPAGDAAPAPWRDPLGERTLVDRKDGAP